MEGLITPEPSACLTPSHCCPCPLSPPELFFRAAQGCRVGGREGLPSLGAACQGVPLLRSLAGWGDGGAEGEQDSSAALNLIS